MAKWGEGDPRWIVEERPDATNVNNWHWCEKNASGWSKEKFKLLFEGMTLDEPGLALVTINEVSKAEGEAMINNRKGKLIYFYEWVLKLDWQASLYEDPKKEITGTIEIPNLSEENDASEVDVNVALSVGGSKGELVKEFIRKKGYKNIQDKMQEYIVALKREYASDLILPTKDQATVKSSKTCINSAHVEKSSHINMINATNNMDKLDLGSSFSTSRMTQTQNFKCTADDLYRALTQREMVVAFTRCDVKLEVEKGGKFELFGGNIIGEYTGLICSYTHYNILGNIPDLVPHSCSTQEYWVQFITNQEGIPPSYKVPNKQISQKWRFRSWPSGHFSEVVIDLVQKEDQTELTLTQTGIPTNDLERTKQGWHNYYWESIKRTFGFGAMLI